MKRTLLSATILLCCGAPFYGQTPSYNWKSATNGNLEDTAMWSPDGFTPDGSHLNFGVTGNYKVALGEDMSAYSMQLKGASGTVILDLGSHALSLTSIFLVNQNTNFTSGRIQGTVQVGSTASDKVLAVSGSSTQLTSASSVFVGRNDATKSGNNNHVSISEGALFEVNNTVILGDNNKDGATANGNSLTVTGAGSRFKASSLLVGNLTGSSAASQSSNNSFVVTDGATAELGGLTVARKAGTAGTNNAAKGNRVLVGGGSGSSVLTITGAISVGSPGGDNTIKVEKDGTINATGGQTAINNGVGNALILEDGTYVATGQKVIVYGSSNLTLTGASTLTASEMDLRATLNTGGSSIINLDKLTLSNTALINASISSSSDYTQIKISSTDEVIFDGIFSLTFEEGYQATAGVEYQVFSFTKSSGQFTELRLPDLAAGLQWDTGSFYETGTLAVIPEARSHALAMTALGVFALMSSKRFIRQ